MNLIARSNSFLSSNSVHFIPSVNNYWSFDKKSLSEVQSGSSELPSQVGPASRPALSVSMSAWSTFSKNPAKSV